MVIIRLEVDQSPFRRFYDHLIGMASSRVSNRPFTFSNVYQVEGGHIGEMCCEDEVHIFWGREETEDVE